MTPTPLHYRCLATVYHIERRDASPRLYVTLATICGTVTDYHREAIREALDDLCTPYMVADVPWLHTDPDGGGYGTVYPNGTAAYQELVGSVELPQPTYSQWVDEALTGIRLDGKRSKLVWAIVPVK